MKQSLTVTEKSPLIALIAKVQMHKRIKDFLNFFLWKSLDFIELPNLMLECYYPENHYHPTDIPPWSYRSCKCHILWTSCNSCPEDTMKGLSILFFCSLIFGVYFWMCIRFAFFYWLSRALALWTWPDLWLSSSSDILCHLLYMHV